MLKIIETRSKLVQKAHIALELQKFFYCYNYFQYSTMSSSRVFNAVLHQFKRKCISLPFATKTKNTHRIAHRHLVRLPHATRYSPHKAQTYKYCINQLPHRRQSSPSNMNNDEQIENTTEEAQESSSFSFHRYVMPKFRDIRKWDKFEWIFSASFLVQFIGFLSYDFMFLRCLSLISSTGLMIAHYGRQFFVGWFWAMALFMANIFTLYHMLREKYSLDMGGLTAEEESIYSQFFKPFAISPLEYKHILKIGQFEDVGRGETLTVKGLICDKLFFIVSGQCVVLNGLNEQIGVIVGGNKKAFVGEIALIDDTQDVATATVKTNTEKTRLLYWDVDELKYFLSHSKAELRVKVINVFTASMKMKLMGLNANFNVEKSIQFKRKNFIGLVQMLLISKGKLKMAESVNVDKVEFVIGDSDEKIQLSVDEQMYLMQYAKQHQIDEQFVNETMEKYHIVE